MYRELYFAHDWPNHMYNSGDGTYAHGHVYCKITVQREAGENADLSVTVKSRFWGTGDISYGYTGRLVYGKWYASLVPYTSTSQFDILGAGLELQWSGVRMPGAYELHVGLLSNYKDDRRIFSVNLTESFLSEDENFMYPPAWSQEFFLSEADKGFFASLFSPSTQSLEALKGAVEGLRMAGPWGSAKDISEEDIAPVGSEEWDVTFDVWDIHHPRQVAGGQRGNDFFRMEDVPLPGSDFNFYPNWAAYNYYSPWMITDWEDATLFTWRGVFRWIFRGAIWLMFCVGFVMWAKGKVSV